MQTTFAFGDFHKRARKPRPAVPALAVTGKTRDSPDLQTTNETHRGSPALQENAQTRAYRSALALRSARIKMSVRGVSEFHRAIFLLGSPIRLRFGVLIFCLKLRWASPRNFSQKRPPVPTSRSSHSPRACILACARRSVKRSKFCAAACCCFLTLPSFTSSRPSAQTTPQKCREQSESARRPSEFLCRISLGQSAIWLKFCVFILCTKICRAYPKEFIESASFAAAAGASAHANAQHGVPVRRRSNSIGTFADLFFMLFSIISMPFWRDWSANGVGSLCAAKMCAARHVALRLRRRAARRTVSARATPPALARHSPPRATVN